VAYPGRPPDHRRCRATANATGERCWRWALRGHWICQKHGGQFEAVRRKAKERDVLRKALPEVEAFYERQLASLRRVAWPEDYRRLDPGGD
jgi:hypothetical protein